ncbi:MAG: hypothetical protein DID90_2727554679 [Candidatus Nitrotoga sp. LAW]|nr:MAG: hypothetical protein DID90_2727554679 [Candidatus Nitrotoga sp. LAW]
MPRKINLIPDLMFPIPPLPNTPLSLVLTAGTNVFVFYQPPREPGLDERLAHWVVGIARWQAPYRMQVFGYASKMAESYRGMAEEED